MTDMSLKYFARLHSIYGDKDHYFNGWKLGDEHYIAPDPNETNILNTSEGE